MNDLDFAAEQISSLIENMTRNAGFNITHTVRTSPDTPNLRVLFKGPDACLLLRNDGALLTAISHIVFEVLQIRPQDEEQILFDLLDNQADLAWEFHRSNALTLSHPPTTAVHRPVTLTQRENSECISTEMWERLESFRLHDGSTQN
jgi:hypothetical protein